MTQLKLGNTMINREIFDIPYIIAEVGVNHEGDLERAKEMIKDISKAGCNAVKFQAYKAESLASRNSPAYWDLSKEPTKSQFDLFKKFDKFGESEFKELADCSKLHNLDFIVTPFDIESTDYLENLACSYKVASADINNKPFLKYVANKRKPIILSTGASTKSEISQAIEWINEESNDQIILLHCILNYPTEYRNANLGMIDDLQKSFRSNVIGYSDHTTTRYSKEVLLTAWLLGAKVIEKHYTWNKNLIGNDHYHSMDYADLVNIIDSIRLVNEIIGQFDKNYLPSEELSRKYARRSLVASRFIKKGTTIKNDDITWKRPGIGIPPWMIDWIIDGKALRDINEDEILYFEDIFIEKK